MKIFFDHEKLNAYQEALGFVAWTEPILERIPKTGAVYSQLDRARTSIVLNIAEGNAKYTSPDRCKFFDISRGSAVECAACLDLLFVRQALAESEVEAGKARLSRIVSMLIGLMKSSMPDRFREEQVVYQTGQLNGEWDREENRDPKQVGD